MATRIVNDDISQPAVLTDTISEEVWQLGCGILVMIVGGFAGWMVMTIIGRLP